MPNGPSHVETVSEELRKKAEDLFTYLKEISQLRLVTVRDCRNYERVLWFYEIPHEPECSCVAWGIASEFTDSWINVRRAAEHACPEPPIACKNWVNLADLVNSSATPVLPERVPAENRVPTGDVRAPEYLELPNSPEVRSAWEHYLKSKWEPWAKEHERWKSVQQVYGKLFAIYQQYKRLGESYELHIALGLLSCQTPSGERVYRHLILGQGGRSSPRRD